MMTKSPDTDEKKYDIKFVKRFAWIMWGFGFLTGVMVGGLLV